MANDDVLIIGRLEDDDLKKSVDNLVDYIGSQTNEMANKFQAAMDKMMGAMKDFAITQKVSVDLMKQAWKDMGASFDAMFDAEKRGTGGGKGSGKPTYPDNTVGALEQEIATLKKERKEMELNTDVLANQNTLLEERKRLLKEQTTAKPRSLADVMGMDEKSVDDIAKKMRALKQAQIDPNNAAQVKQLGDEYQRLKRLQAELMGMNIQHTKSNNYLAQSFGYIRNRIVYALTLGAISNFTKQIYEVRGQYELLERSLGVLLNSFERGTQVFQELNKMAIESPFTLMELAGGAKQLSAYNFEAKEVVDTTRRLADISAALGVPMERLVYNLGQIRAQTRLTARDARDFANAGLPIVSALAERFSNLEGKIVTTGDVYDRMTKKMVSYNDVMAVINDMTDEGGKFFEFQAKQAETLRVQMANLTLAWNNMLNEMGEGNQDLLSAPVKGLKSLLQNWESLNRVIKNVILSFGILRGVQMIAIRFNWELAASASGAARMMGFLGNVMKGFWVSLVGLFANKWTWAFVGILAITDLIGKMRAARQNIEELNDEIRNAAAEAAKSTNDFYTNKGSVTARQLAKENMLTAEQGEKAWEKLREQIEQSAMSSNKLIGKLLEIEDINERVRTGFDYVKEINQAAYALAELGDEDIKISQDSGWFGMFGEGLVSDLKDYTDELKAFEGTYLDFQRAIKTPNTLLTINYKEFQNELKVTAESIKDFLDKNNIKDPLQINEILERVRAKIKEKNPQIKGEMANVFDLELDKQMSQLTNGAVDQNASLWAIFMERLKHQSSATFQGITDDWVKSSDKLSKEQQAAVDENLEYFKKSMPYAYDAVAKMVADASKLKIQIGVAFNVQSLSDFQKQVKDRIDKNGGLLDFGNESMWGTSNDNLTTWVDTRQKAIKALKEENKLYAKDESEWAKKKIADNDREIQQNKNLLDLFHQSYEAEKKSKGGSNKKDVLGEALKKEVELIDNIQKRYKEYEKMGVDAQTAIAKATDEYGTTLKNVGTVLEKYGIKTKSGKELAGMDMRGVRDYLQTLLNYAKALGNEKGVEAIEKSLAKINVEITKVDYKKIADGLNNELSKLKDEYELAVELDANPELGGMFAQMLGIDTDALPQTFAEALERANKLVTSKLKLNNFDLMSTKITPDDAGLWNGMAYDSDTIQKLVNAQKQWRELYRKNLESTEKMLDDYVKKYGDYSDKMAEIEAKRLAQIKELNDAFYTEEMRKSKEYRANLNAINASAESEKGQVKWDEFMNSTLYITMFENLEYASTKTLQAIHEKLEQLKGDWKQLKPEQLKTITDKYLQIETQLSKRNPFKELIKNAKEYAKAVGSSGKKAQENLKKVQDEHDAAENLLATLKSEAKQMEASNMTNNIAYKILLMTIDAQDEKVKKLKQELSAASELVMKYDMMRKIFKEQTSSIAATVNLIANNLQGIAEFRDTLNALFGVDASKGETLLGHNLDGVIDGLSKTGQAMSSIVSSATSGNVFGVVGGVVNVFAGIGDTISSIFGGGSAKTKRLNAEINKSVETVRKLSLAYKDLEYAVENAMGAAELQARRQEMVNKEAQMRELQRQKQLESEKRSKDRDDDRIKELESSIKDLQIELQEMANEIASTLLGSKVKDAAEAFVNTWVDAWRAGENTMAALDGKFDDMIDNMIMKSIASKIVASRLQRIWDAVDEITSERSEGGAGVTMNELQRIKDLIGDKSIREAIDEDLKALYGVLGIAYGSNADKSLSALQQGIQSVTEDTAGAIEAYMNGMSQQVYLQSDLLTEIRDAVVAMDSEFQMSTLGEILLQLRSSYEMQMAIHAMMEGWTTPSGNGIRVELLS